MMTVQQYEISFNHLSRFAAPLIATLNERIWRFARGLKLRIHHDVLAIELLTNEENVTKAFFSENMNRQIKGDEARDHSVQSRQKRGNPTLS